MSNNENNKLLIVDKGNITLLDNSKSLSLQLKDQVCLDNLMNFCPIITEQHLTLINNSPEAILNNSHYTHSLKHIYSSYPALKTWAISNKNPDLLNCTFL